MDDEDDIVGDVPTMTPRQYIELLNRFHVWVLGDDRVPVAVAMGDTVMDGDPRFFGYVERNRVALTEVTKDTTVSTVFVPGIYFEPQRAQRIGQNPDWYFETMATGPFGEVIRKSMSWERAEEIHQEVVDRIKRGSKP